MMNTIFQDHFSNHTSSAEEEASRLVLQNTQDIYVLADPQLSIVYFNKAAEENVRHYLEIDLYVGMNLLQVAREERREYIEEVCANVLRGQRHFTELNFRALDGSDIYFENNFLPAYNENRKIIGIIVFSKDITAIKKAQQAIQESEERLQFALEAAHQGAWDWDLQTHEVTYSSSYKKLYGFAENELKDHVSEWITRIHPDDQKKMRESVAEHLQAEDPVYDSQYRIRDKDGRYRWVMAKGRLVSKSKDGNPLRMMGTHTDITENVEREIALKQINERFNSVMKATHDLLWEWDVVNNRVFRSKESLKKIYDVHDNSHIPTLNDWLLCIHPEERQTVQNTLNEVLKAAHQHTFEMEYRFRGDDGEYAYIYDRGILLKDEQNQPVRIIGSAQDISERKRLEKELLQNELEYQRAIHQATVDSQERERAEIGKELHDNVNQVLTTTKLYLDLALTNAEIKEELIQKSLRNINTIIQEIRHLSRSLMDPSLGDLGLVDSIKDLIESIHLTQRIKIDFVADGNVDAVLDENQKLAVFRIVQESLNNVLRHARASKLFISIALSGDQLLMTLKDNGIGFQQDALKRGAGLKNIQNRIYLINGTLQLQSQPNEGCTITLQFPVKTTIEN